MGFTGLTNEAGTFDPLSVFLMPFFWARDSSVFGESLMGGALPERERSGQQVSREGDHFSLGGERTTVEKKQFGKKAPFLLGAFNFWESLFVASHFLLFFPCVCVLH